MAVRVIASWCGKLMFVEFVYLQHTQDVRSRTQEREKQLSMHPLSDFVLCHREKLRQQRSKKPDVTELPCLALSETRCRRCTH